MQEILKLFTLKYSSLISVLKAFGLLNHCVENTETTTPTTCGRRGAARSPMGESDKEIDSRQFCENKKHIKEGPAIHRLKMYNVKFIPTNNGQIQHITRYRMHRNDNSK